MVEILLIAGCSFLCLKLASHFFLETAGHTDEVETRTLLQELRRERSKESP